MKDFGLTHYFLGVEVWQRQGNIFLAQGKYTVDVLNRFGMMDCKSMSTPMVTNLRKLHDSDTSSDLEDPVIAQFVLVPKKRAKGGQIGVTRDCPIIVTLIRHLFLLG
jgi:hypothetical protein